MSEKAIRTLRVEIASPVGGTWDELGTMLRTQRRIMAQLLRAGMDARIASGVVGADAVKSKIAPDARGKSAGTMIYQAMKLELEKIQKGKWKDEQRPALQLCGGMLSALAQRVTQNYSERSGYGSAQPIPVRKQELKIRELESRIVVDMLLVSGGRTKVYAHPSRGTHWSKLRAIAAGELPHGDCRIVYDDRRRKWYMLIAYEAEKQAPLTVDPSRALVVHRGVHNVLYLLSTTGFTKPEPGRKLLAQLTQFEVRIRDAKRVSVAELGDGSRGHGKARRYEHYEVLSGKRDRIARTFCQQAAALVVSEARARGCGLVVIEDYGGIGPAQDDHVRRALVRFPFFKLKQSILDAAEVAGLTVREVPAEYVSTTCPACETQDARSHNRTTGTFHCACGLERPADFVAALNMLRRSGLDSALWDERMKQFERLRAAVKEECA